MILVAFLGSLPLFTRSLESSIEVAKSCFRGGLSELFAKKDKEKKVGVMRKSLP